MNLISALQSEKKLVDVRGFEPLTPCLQSREGKTLKCFDGVAYTDNQQNSRSPVVPKLYRVLVAAGAAKASSPIKINQREKAGSRTSSSRQPL